MIKTQKEETVSVMLGKKTAGREKLNGNQIKTQ